jgi:hypothetical protein
MQEGSEMKKNELSQEQRILHMVRKTLIGVIKDTTTAPELKHPLSYNTIIEIKQTLDLITTRERELMNTPDDGPQSRPYYVDEPQESVRVSLPKRNKPKT